MNAFVANDPKSGLAAIALFEIDEEESENFAFCGWAVGVATLVDLPYFVALAQQGTMALAHVELRHFEIANLRSTHSGIEEKANEGFVVEWLNGFLGGFDEGEDLLRGEGLHPLLVCPRRNFIKMKLLILWPEMSSVYLPKSFI